MEGKTMDRFTNYNRTKGTGREPEMRSRIHASKCADRRATVSAVVALLEAKPWTSKKVYGYGGTSWIDATMDDDSLAWIADATDKFADLATWQAVDALIEDIGLAYLRAQGYEVPADANYDHVVDVLGGGAERTMQDVYAIVNEANDNRESLLSLLA
jgi:hypothetical protein